MNNKDFEVDYDQRITQLERIKDSLNKKNYTSQNMPRKKPVSITDKKNTESKGEDNFKNKTVVLSKFDPNIATYEELVKFGFTEFAARNLISFRLKGGFFRKNEDLKRIYGVDSLLYSNIQLYAIFADEKTNENIMIEINSADSAALTTLKGIGPVYASRICKYRKYLGGFVSLNQLKEVYQFPEETYQTIRKYLTLDETNVKKYNINFASVNELKEHPYCSYDDARKIIDYRSKKGFVQSVEQLLNDSVIEMKEFNRFSPYLKVQ